MFHTNANEVEAVYYKHGMQQVVVVDGQPYCRNVYDASYWEEGVLLGKDDRNDKYSDRDFWKPVLAARSDEVFNARESVKSLTGNTQKLQSLIAETRPGHLIADSQGNTIRLGINPRFDLNVHDEKTLEGIDRLASFYLYEKKHIINSLRLGGGIWDIEGKREAALQLLTPEEQELANTPIVVRYREIGIESDSVLNFWLAEQNATIVKHIHQSEEFKISDNEKAKVEKSLQAVKASKTFLLTNKDRKTKLVVGLSGTQQQLIRELERYIETKRSESKSLFSSFLGWFSGMSAIKIRAAERIMLALNHPEQVGEFKGDLLEALQEGELGKIMAKYKREDFPVQYVNSLKEYNYNLSRRMW